MLFKSKNPSYEHLRKKWTAKHKNLQEKIFDKHPEINRHLLLGGVGSLMLLTTPAVLAIPPQITFPSNNADQITKATDKNMTLMNALKEKVPDEVRSLTPIEEEEIAHVLSENLNLKVLAEIDGKRLNRTYGLIGGEQHLYRYPGDNVYKHADNTSDWAMYGGSGIAPGLGAWGYFAPSEAEFTEKDKQRERYYLAVQTFLSPGFAERVAEYRDFYKYRKMIVVNPKTGQAVVAVIGDAGPAEWTGKHLGGSPEVMHSVGLAGGPRKGPVLYFFIDDPEDQIPLGPIKISEANS
jgi:hypothetical protein